MERWRKEDGGAKGTREEHHEEMTQPTNAGNYTFIPYYSLDMFFPTCTVELFQRGDISRFPDPRAGVCVCVGGGGVVCLLRIWTVVLDFCAAVRGTARFPTDASDRFPGLDHFSLLANSHSSTSSSEHIWLEHGRTDQVEAIITTKAAAGHMAAHTMEVLWNQPLGS